MEVLLKVSESNSNSIPTEEEMQLVVDSPEFSERMQIWWEEMQRRYTSFDEIKATLKKRVPVSEVARWVLELEEFMDKFLCPFHEGSDYFTLVVDDRTGKWKCTNPGCPGSRGGDIFDLVMRVKKVHYAEAIGILADQYPAISIPADLWHVTQRHICFMNLAFVMKRGISKELRQTLKPAGITLLFLVPQAMDYISCGSVPVAHWKERPAFQLPEVFLQRVTGLTENTVSPAMSALRFLGFLIRVPRSEIRPEKQFKRGEQAHSYIVPEYDDALWREAHRRAIEFCAAEAKGKHVVKKLLARYGIGDYNEHYYELK